MVKDMKKEKIIIMAVLIGMNLAACGNNANASTESSSSSEGIFYTSEPSSISEPTSEAVYYKDDSVVNQFISDFNSSNEDQITDIREGNIKQKAFAYIGDVYIEILDSYSAAAENFNISIYGGNTEEKTEKMFSAFIPIVKTLDLELTDEQINEEIALLKENDVLTEDASLGTLLITYVPSKELSYGRNDSRIDISSASYARTE